MAKRPNLLDLRADSHNSGSSSASRSLRSPRMHIAGEAPPELSPLDAFALQSRLLARQLQEATKDGNRVSRLPPLTVESPLIVQGRSDYFRSLSQDSIHDTPASPGHGDGVGQRTEVEEGFEGCQRPVSMHPRMSRVQPSSEDAVPPMPDSIPDLPRNRLAATPEPRGDFFGTRTRSPSPIRSDTQSQYDKRSDKSPVRRGGSALGSSSQTAFAPHVASPERKQRSYDDAGLAPPRPSFLSQRPSSITSSSYGSVEDDASSNPAGSVQPAPARKMSSGSAAFAAAGGNRPGSFHRSPSVSSDCSALPRPSFNFSRPLSRAGTPLFDVPSRQASSDSQPSFVLADDAAYTPVSIHSEAFLDQQAEDARNAAPSYIYSKFSLPRGKSIQRDEPTEPLPTASFQWEQPNVPHSNVHKIPQPPPSPPTRPSSSSARVMSDDAASVFTRPSLDVPKASLDIARFNHAGYPSPNPSRPSLDMMARRSEDAPRGRTMQSPLNEGARGRTPASTGTSDSASTIRGPPTIRSAAPSSSDMTAEEHLAKGIKCHETGSLNESTYHLRLAARRNNPTAMLLYALACRHGWGMRANQREGVEWLRKAAEYASVEIADDEDQLKEGKHVDFLESRTRKAQFALSVYELGVSHMNGWGIEQDKSLALRCFEIAGNWGDVDALAEAGFCYAQGVGCKKNLKISAKFYRMAEAKGMSMVGNSWIHKSKYNEAKTSPEKEKEKEKDKKKTRARSKSRTRAMFGLKG